MQIGAREHYAIPRALHRIGRLTTLVTDRWNTIANSLSDRILPAKLYRPIQSRFHQELASANVVSFNSKNLVFEFSNKTGNQWQRVQKRNQWFQDVAKKRFLELVQSNPGATVFAYSYAAKEFFEIAKRYGCKTVLGQIDPGKRETEIVEQLHLNAGLPPYQKPPQIYWDQWYKECDLADAILVNSEWSRSLLSEQEIELDKLHVIPLCYEPKTTKANLANSGDGQNQTIEPFSKSNPLKVLFLGQVVARKGIVELLESIDQLQDQPISWTVVGGGDTHLVDQLKQRTNVDYYNQVSRDEVGNYFPKHDLFVLPTHSDGFAITQLESIHFELPVVASKYCGRVVDDGVNGIVLDSVSADSISSAMYSVLKRPSLLKHFQKNIQSQSNNRYSLTDLLDDLLHVETSIHLMKKVSLEGLGP